MKRIVSMVAAVAMALTIVACAASGSLAVESNETGVHAVATGSAEGMGTGNITISEGYGLCVNHIVEKGAFHVKATDSKGNVVFDKDLTNNIADLVPANGEIEVVVSAKNATGTVDIIAYDEEAQAQADATMPEDVKQMLNTTSD